MDAAVAVRLARTATADPVVRRLLGRAERLLRREIGPSVPKRRAAALLSVSTTALERWTAGGRLPTLRRPGGREEIDAAALLDLLEETTRLREEGRTRGVLAAAFARLAARGLPRRRPRPNQSARELRSNFLATTPAQRLREGAELSEFATTFAGRAVRARREQADAT